MGARWPEDVIFCRSAPTPPGGGLSDRTFLASPFLLRDEELCSALTPFPRQPGSLRESLAYLAEEEWRGPSHTPRSPGLRGGTQHPQTLPSQPPSLTPGAGASGFHPDPMELPAGPGPGLQRGRVSGSDSRAQAHACAQVEQGGPVRRAQRASPRSVPSKRSSTTRPREMTS